MTTTRPEEGFKATEIKNCPLCGDKMHLINATGMIKCFTGGCPLWAIPFNAVSFNTRPLEDRLTKRVQELEAILTIVQRWLGTGYANEDFEEIADWFHRDTGYLRPGKDSASPIDDYEERKEAWEKWRKEKAATVRVKIALALIPKKSGQFPYEKTY